MTLYEIKEYEKLPNDSRWSTVGFWKSYNIEKIFNLVSTMSMYVGLCTCIQVCPDTREGTRVSGARVIGVYEPYDMGAGSWTQVFWKYI